MKENNINLPVSLDQITAEWLSQALACNYPGTVVTACEIGDVMWGTSTKIWVRVQYNAKGEEHRLPSSLVVKGGFEEHSRSMAYMYDNEIKFYQHIAPRLKMNVPKCYFAGTDQQQHQSIVILEDLRLAGADFHGARQPFSYARVAAFLDAQAEYHAQWWGRPELQPGGSLDWISTPLGGFGKGGYISRMLQPYIWEPEHWQGCMQTPHCSALSRVLHDPRRIRGALEKLAEYHQVGPLTLAHGDTHPGNLYSLADGTPGFLDAQVRRSVWYQDVTYHIVSALDVVDRRNWERALLERYLRRLELLGCPAPGFDEAWLAYRCEILYGLFIWIINTDKFQHEAINTTVCARFGAAALDHGILDLLS